MRTVPNAFDSSACSTGSVLSSSSGSTITSPTSSRIQNEATSAPNAPGCHSGWRRVQRQTFGAISIMPSD